MRSAYKHRAIVGEAVRRARKKAALSQEALAERADLHPNYVGEIERGETNISLDVIVRLAAALETRVASLLRDL